MPGDPEECRQHALNCVRLAQGSASAEARMHFASLARARLKLAADLESGQTLLGALNGRAEEANRLEPEVVVGCAGGGRLAVVIGRSLLPKSVAITHEFKAACGKGLVQAPKP
jgi:hypothetical protein